MLQCVAVCCSVLQCVAVCHAHMHVRMRHVTQECGQLLLHEGRQIDRQTDRQTNRQRDRETDTDTDTDRQTDRHRHLHTQKLMYR